MEAFITCLQTAQVKTVVDVRELPLSRKKGVSKTAFLAALHELVKIAHATSACLVCFEADFSTCHRTYVARAARQLGGPTVMHLTDQAALPDLCDQQVAWRVDRIWGEDAVRRLACVDAASGSVFTANEP